ncbi:MAG: sigma-70 family RNA polymerase sigma factor [Anaerolineae bacterium]|nr:sigma-70 family RNA polymerase sigma factor [Anaerolineae bacterium]
MLPNESVLIQRAQKGDLGAFNQLVLGYQSHAYNVAYRLLGDSEEAADATQDAFLKAYKALRQFHGGSFRAWLLRIVTNTCYDLLRVRRHYPTDSIEAMQDDPDEPRELPYHGEGPEEHALRVEAQELIQAGIDALPREQRVVLVLSDIEGLSYQETAQIVGVELGTVKSRLSRARGRLRGFLTSQVPAGARGSTRTGYLPGWATG